MVLRQRRRIRLCSVCTRNWYVLWVICWRSRKGWGVTGPSSLGLSNNSTGVGGGSADNDLVTVLHESRLTLRRMYPGVVCGCGNGTTNRKPNNTTTTKTTTTTPPPLLSSAVYPVFLFRTMSTGAKTVDTMLYTLVTHKHLYNTAAIWAFLYLSPPSLAKY